MPTVTIIGAGPAGSTAATLLSRRGWDVTLIEQHRFPREKVCGECLSALGIDVATRAGLRDHLVALRPVELRSATLVPARGRETTVALPRPTWGLSRAALDRALLEAANDAGIRLWQPVRCEALLAPTPGARVRDLGTNEVCDLRSDYVLLADGRAAFAQDRPPPTRDLGVKAHFTGVDDARDRIGLFGLAGHYVGVAPIEAGRWNLAMSVPAEKVKALGGDLDALYALILRENPRLAARFRGATRVGDWLASPLPRFPVRQRWPSRVIPLGNAAAALEPIGGEGMGLAMRSAEIVVEELFAAEAEGRACDPHLLRRRMSQLWSPRRLGCRAGAVLLSRPRLAHVMSGVASPVARLALRVIRK